MFCLRFRFIAICFIWSSVSYGWEIIKWKYKDQTSWKHGTAYLGRLKIVWWGANSMNTPEWERDAREFEEDWYKYELTEEEREEMEREAEEAFRNMENEYWDHIQEETNHPLGCACGSPFCSNYQPDNSCPW